MDPRSWNDDTPSVGNQHHQPQSAPRYPREPYQQNPYPRDPYADTYQQNPYPREPYGRSYDRPYESDEEYGQGRHEEEPAGWRRYRSIIAVGVSVAVVAVLSTVGWLLIRPSDDGGGGPFNQAAGDVVITTSGAPSVTATTSAPAPTTTPPKKPTPSKTTLKPRPTPSKKPPPAQLPPPPPPPVQEQPSCEKHLPGTDATSSVVASTLSNAAGNHYWQGVVPPTGADGAAVAAISTEARLIKAFAWTESTWRSTIIACDGGIGLMQVMPDNATFLNQRFGTDYDVNSTTGNAALGATYVQYLVAYFGTYYFGSYDLMHATAMIGPDHSEISLLNVVIAAYNVGYGEVEDLHGTADGSDDTLSIPNQSYVDKVRAAYNDQPWS